MDVFSVQIYLQAKLRVPKVLASDEGSVQIYLQVKLRVRT